MKKIIFNIVFAFLLAVIITIICVVGVFLSEINSTPPLLVHVIPSNGTLPYYVVQHDLVNRWKTYCTALIIIASITALLPIIGLVNVNITSLSSEAREQRKKLRNSKRIQSLEAELEELKKD